MRSPARTGELPLFAGIFDRAAPHYERTGVEFFTPLGRALVAGARLRRGDRVLDVGCGRGACTFPAARAVGQEGRAVGIDLAPGMLAAATADATAQGISNVEFRAGDGADPDFATASFDAVLAGFSLFFLPDPPAALTVYRRLIRSGGGLAISSYGADDPRFFQVTDTFLDFLPAGMPPLPGREAHNPFTTRDGIARLVAGAGFADVRIEERDIDMTFHSRRQWWDWLWTTAGRIIMEMIPRDRHEDARRAAYREMDNVRDSAGRLTIRWNIYFTYATRPAREGIT